VIGRIEPAGQRSRPDPHADGGIFALPIRQQRRRA
jgi:hypothetical protein